MGNYFIKILSRDKMLRRKMNVILIVIDALRPDFLGCYNKKARKLSTNIDKLGEKSLVFENAFSCTNTTDPSITSIETGMFPRTHGIKNHGEKISSEEMKKFDKTVEKTLAEILLEENYSTHAVDWLGRWHKRGYNKYTGLRPHFKNFFKRNKYLLSLLKKFYKLNKALNFYEDGKKVTSNAINFIKNLNEEDNFFLFLHYWDAHIPYFNNYPKIPINFRNESKKKILGKCNGCFKKQLENILEKDLKATIESYSGEVRYVDYCIGKLIEFLKEKEIIDNTIILITSDHGESLGEHNIYFDHHGLYEPTIKVPFIIYHPDLKNKRISSLIQHIDIFPTLLDLLNIDRTENVDGLSLLPLIENDKESIRDFIYNEECHTQQSKCIRTKEWKYIKRMNEEKCRYCNIHHGEEEQLYNLNLDRGEKKNLIETREEAKNHLKKVFKEFTNSALDL